MCERRNAKTVQLPIKILFMDPPPSLPQQLLAIRIRTLMFGLGVICTFLLMHTAKNNIKHIQIYDFLHNKLQFLSIYDELLCLGLACVCGYI